MIYYDRIFRGFDLATGTWTDTAAYAGAAATLLVYGLVLLLRRPEDKSYYRNHMAWLRGFGFFSLCFSLAAATGVMDAAISNPWGPVAGSSNWLWLSGLAVFAFIIVRGYLLIWPRGSYIKDRRFYPISLVFGLTWGLAEGMFHLSVYALIEQAHVAISNGLGSELFFPPLVAFLTMLAIPAYHWHFFYWDIYVEPAHNILETNNRKALGAHIPNFVCAMIMLVLFASPGLHLLMQTVALLATTVALRFPPPWPSEWSGRPVDPTGGRPAEDVGFDLATQSFRSGYR